MVISVIQFQFRKIFDLFVPSSNIPMVSEILSDISPSPLPVWTVPSRSRERSFAFTALSKGNQGAGIRNPYRETRGKIRKTSDGLMMDRFLGSENDVAC